MVCAVLPLLYCHLLYCPSAVLPGQVMDALKMEFADDSFDLVWACESGEHMPDKKAYVEEMARVLAPGGQVRWRLVYLFLQDCKVLDGSTVVPPTFTQVASFSTADDRLGKDCGA